MDLAKLFELTNASVWVMIKISMPMLLVALVVGLLVSLFQALTQIQEPTLSFVPKILAVFAVMLLMSSYIGTTMSDYAANIMHEITALE